MSIRQAVIAHLELLAQPSMQLDYETKVPNANVRAELVNGFCSDLYHPKSRQFLDAFSEDELRDLAHLYGLLMESGQVRASSMAELLQHSQWRRVVAFAKDLAASRDRSDVSSAVAPNIQMQRTATDKVRFSCERCAAADLER